MNNLISTTREITTIDINLNYGEIYFETGDTFSTYYENICDSDFVIEENENSLSIQDKRKGNFRLFGKKYEYTPIVRITVPKHLEFDKISLSTGACEVHAESLTTKVFSLKMGAGEFHINEFNISNHASIESGAGEIHINDGIINNLGISSGAGEVVIHAALTGNSNITAGVGEIDLHLIGNPEDYSATISKGIGRLCVSGFNTWNGMCYGDGANHITISGGIGEIRITI